VVAGLDAAGRDVAGLQRDAHRHPRRLQRGLVADHGGVEQAPAGHRLRGVPADHRAGLVGGDQADAAGRDVRHREVALGDLLADADLVPRDQDRLASVEPDRQQAGRGGGADDEQDGERREARAPAARWARQAVAHGGGRRAARGRAGRRPVTATGGRVVRAGHRHVDTRSAPGPIRDTDPDSSPPPHGARAPPKPASSSTAGSPPLRPRHACRHVPSVAPYAVWA
jgi:hypothetical protein